MPPLTESTVEHVALEWFGELGYAVGRGPNLAPGEQAEGTLTLALSHAERGSRGEVVQSRFARTLTRPLPWGEEKHEAIRRLNPTIPEEAFACAIHADGRAIPANSSAVQIERRLNP